MIQESARLGILQKDKETIALIPEIKCGMMTPNDLEKLAAVSRKYAIPAIKITSAQRIALVGVKPEHVAAIWEDLDMEPGHGLGTGLNYIQACPGTTVCRLGQRNSLELAERIYDIVKPMEIATKLKFGISGCPLQCGEGAVRDVGIFGKKATGWTIQIGGNSGLNARVGEVLAKDLDDEQLIAVITKLMQYYKDNMKPKERMYRFVPRMGGVAAIRKAIGLEE